MKYGISYGDVLTLTAPSGGVVGGNAYLIDDLPVVAFADADEGTKFAACVTGVFSFVSAANFTEGAVAFYHVTNHTVTPTSATGLVPIGHFASAGSSGARAEVRLAGVTAAAVG